MSVGKHRGTGAPKRLVNRVRLRAALVLGQLADSRPTSSAPPRLDVRA